MYCFQLLSLLISLLRLLMMLQVACDEDSGQEWSITTVLESIADQTGRQQFCSPNSMISNRSLVICDPDAILTSTEVDELSELLNSGQNSTKCFCSESCERKGLPIRIALLQMIEFNENESLERQIESFAKQIQSKWNSGCRYDVLIFVCTVYDKVYIQMRPSAERAIGKRHLEGIVADSMKSFLMREYYQALSGIILDLQVRANKHDPKTEQFGLFNSTLVWILSGVASLLALAIIVALRMRKEAKQAKISNQSVAMAKQINQEGVSLVESQ